jgi:hypothetical protein
MLTLIFAFVILATPAAPADKRAALVIGNAERHAAVEPCRAEGVKSRPRATPWPMNCRTAVITRTMSHRPFERS